MGMSAHNIRVDDNVWSPAVARAAAEGTNLSELIRQWLEDYMAGGEANADRAKIRLTVEELCFVAEALGRLDIGGVVINAVNKER